MISSWKVFALAFTWMATFACSFLLHASLAWGQDESRYLGNNQRTGYTDAVVPTMPELIWSLTEKHAPRHAWQEPNREEQFIDFDYATQVAIGHGRVVYGSSADHKVRAVDLQTGKEVWHYYTEGPIRFAPVVDGDRVFVTSDDGRLYCLDIQTGKLIWQFLGGPSDAKLIGNDQMISHWPARSGVLIDADSLYFTAGMWSRDGVFVYCLDPNDGTVKWVNDTSGFHFTTLPHASGFGGVAPQGYLALNRNRLYVPTGRGAPACFDAQTGEFRFYENGHGYKPHQPGGSRVMAWKNWVIFKRRSQHVEESVRYDPRVAGKGAASGLYALDFRTGDPAWSLTDKNVVVGHGRHMVLGGAGPVIKVDLEEVLQGYEKFWKDGEHLGPDPNIVDPKLDYTRATTGGKLIPKPAWMTPLPYQKWSADVGQVFVMVQAGNTILAGGLNQVSAIDFRSGKVLWKRPIDGEVRGICVAGEHFVVSSKSGKLYCFGAEDTVPPGGQATTIQPSRNRLETQKQTQQLAARILETSSIGEGYAVMLGAGEGDLLCELARQSKLVIYCLEQDRKKIAAVQAKLDQAGLLGVRAAVHYGTFDQLPYAPYVANLLIWGDQIGSSIAKTDAGELHRILRPYGGKAVQLAGGDTTQETREWLEREAISSDELAQTDLGVVITRGELEGAGQWTHAYANVGRTSSSEDSLAKLPLGMLWWGGPGPGRIVSRHWRAPVPLFSNGVLYIQGQHDVIAVDAYNGREMWNRHLEGIGRFPPNKRGGNIVADEDSVFCVLGTNCLQLDSQTGETIHEFSFPVAEQHVSAIELLKRNDTKPAGNTRIVWEYLGITGDFIIGTLGYETVFEIAQNIDSDAPHQSKFVFVFSKSTGELLWQEELQRAVSAMSLVADQTRLYLLDRTDERLYQLQKRRGAENFASSLRAFDLATGNPVWERSGIGMDRKSLILKDEVLVAYPNPTEKESVDADSGVAVYSAQDGATMWEETKSPLLGDDRRGHFVRHTFVVGDKLFLPRSHDLRTGKPLLLKEDPLTGKSDPFDLCGKNFCGTIAAGMDILAYRSASVGFQEVSRDSGSFWFPEIRPSCWISVVPAGGLILAPEGYSTCICPYNYKTSLALVPVERYEDWSVYLSGRKDKRIKVPANGKKNAANPTVDIATLRLNLNAPGDRMDSDGQLWLAYPRPIRATRHYYDTELPVSIDRVQESFRHNADQLAITQTSDPWLFTSGLEGPIKITVPLPEDQTNTYRIELKFAETSDAAVGDRVFDVLIQGKTVLPKFDIAEDAGGQAQASSHQFEDISAMGAITIELVPIQGLPPRICSVAILKNE